MNLKGEPHMAVSARSMTTRIADAVQAVIEATTRLLDDMAPAARPQLVPVRVRTHGPGARRR